MTSPWPAPPAPIPPVPPKPPEEFTASLPRAPRVRRIPLAAISDVPAVTWLSAFGAALMLVAAIALTPDWKTLSVITRLLIIGLTNPAVIFVAEKSRAKMPIVGRALSHLAPVLLAPSAILAAASAGTHWRASIAVGGVAGLIASEFQYRRLKLALLPFASVAAAILAGAGIAALTNTPMGIVIALLAVVAVVLRREMQAAMLATGAGLVPLVGYLGNIGIGPGTLTDLGARGDALAWAAPVTGLIAALVLFRRAERIGNRILVALGGAVLLTNLAAGLHVLTITRNSALLVPGLGLISAEALAAWKRNDEFWHPFSSAVATAMLLISSTAFLSIGLSYLATTVSHPDVALAIGLATLACGLAVSVFRCRALADVAALVTAELGVVVAGAALALTGQPVAAVAVLVVTAGVVTLRSTLPFWLATTFALAAWWVGVLQPVGHQLIGLNGLTVLLQVAALSLLLGTIRGRMGRAESLFIAFWPAPAMALATWYLVRSTDVAIIVGLFTVVVCLAQLRRNGQTAWLAMLLPIAIFVFAEMRSTAAVSVMAAVVVALLASDRLVHASRHFVRCALAAVTPLTIVTIAARWNATYQSIAAGLLVLGVLAAAASFKRSRPELDTLVMSLFITGLGAALTMKGSLREDLANLLVVTGALFAGMVLCRYRSNTSSWLAYGPALAWGSLYLLFTQHSSQPTRAGLTIGLAIVAIAIGGLRRSAAPLLIGSLTTIATIVIMVGPALAKLSLWLWVAVGGAFLIGLAMLIERKVVEKSGEPHRVLENVLRGFR
jgi:hypothetical protein